MDRLSDASQRRDLVAGQPGTQRIGRQLFGPRGDDGVRHPHRSDDRRRSAAAPPVARPQAPHVLAARRRRRRRTQLRIGSLQSAGREVEQPAERGEPAPADQPIEDAERHGTEALRRRRQETGGPLSGTQRFRRPIRCGFDPVESHLQSAVCRRPQHGRQQHGLQRRSLESSAAATNVLASRTGRLTVNCVTF